MQFWLIMLNFLTNLGLNLFTFLKAFFWAFVISSSPYQDYLFTHDKLWIYEYDWMPIETYFWGLLIFNKNASKVKVRIGSIAWFHSSGYGAWLNSGINIKLLHCVPVKKIYMSYIFLNENFRIATKKLFYKLIDY